MIAVRIIINPAAYRKFRTSNRFRMWNMKLHKAIEIAQFPLTSSQKESFKAPGKALEN